MKLKNIAKRVIAEQNIDYNQIRNDCNQFISQNEIQLENELLIYRGTDRSGVGPVEKVSARERKSIRGNNLLLYFYEKKKPNNFPSRWETVPAQGLQPTRSISFKNTFVVFPIGSNYKFLYAPDVRDFNYNLFTDAKKVFRLQDALMTDITRMFKIRGWGEEKFDYEGTNWETFSTEWFDWVKDLQKRANRLEGEDPKKIVKEYDKIVGELKSEPKFLFWFGVQADNTMNRAEEAIDWYLSKAKVTREIRGDMRGSEVSVYAPNGFYYIDPELVPEIMS